MFFVSRQIYYPDGSHVVEIANGGLDYANPDMLVQKYRGEGIEYSDPLEALEAAFYIAEEWKKITDKEIGIASGSTGGFTLPFEPSSREELEKWCDKMYKSLEKCSYCDKILGKEKYKLELGFEDVFCSNNCADNYLDNYMRDNEEDFTVDDEQRAGIKGNDEQEDNEQEKDIDNV